MNARSPYHSSINEDLWRRHLIFLGGKGGVGKTTLSRHLAKEALAQGKRVQWVVLDPSTPSLPELEQCTQRLTPQAALQEYMHLKLDKTLKWIPFAKQLLEPRFLGKWIQWLADAAPGLSDLLVLGKIWHLRTSTDLVIVDLPSTGHGLQLFQSALNYHKLFKNSLLTEDLLAMLQTLQNPQETAKIIVTLPEDGPLTEALELERAWLERFPNIRPLRWLNRLTPAPGERAMEHPTAKWMHARNLREKQILEFWQPDAVWMWNTAWDPS